LKTIIYSLSVPLYLSLDALFLLDLTILSGGQMDRGIDGRLWHMGRTHITLQFPLEMLFLHPSI
jgi:hypothetical protein